MIHEFLNVLWPVAVFAVCLMFFIWWLALRIKNLGIVDIAWSASFAPVAIFYGACLHGDPTRRWLIAGMAALWSLRLGTHLYFRVMGHHPHEDVRYGKLREKWGANLKSQTFIFFELQAVLIVLLSTPFLIAGLNPQPGVSVLEWAGVIVWAIALAGEACADWQL